MNANRIRICGRKHEHAAGAGDDPAHQQPAQRALVHVVADPVAHRGHARLNEVHGHLCPTEHCLEHQEQDHREQQRSGNGIENDRIQPRQHCKSRWYAISDGVQDPTHLALGSFDFGCRRCGRRCGNGTRRHSEIVAVDGVHQLALTTRPDCHSFNNRDIQSLLQRCPVNPVTTLLGNVAHVQGYEHRPADPLELEDKSQVQPQVGRVDDAHQEVRWRFGGMPAQYHVSGNRFVEARGVRGYKPLAGRSGGRYVRCGGLQIGPPCALP